MPHNMEQVRAAIDNIDAQLISLLAERQAFVARAGELKAGQGDQAVEAPERAAEVIRSRRALAEDARLDPDVAERIWREIIASFVDFERGIARGTN